MWNALATPLVYVSTEIVNVQHSVHEVNGASTQYMALQLDGSKTEPSGSQPRHSGPVCCCLTKEHQAVYLSHLCQGQKGMQEQSQTISGLLRWRRESHAAQPNFSGSCQAAGMRSRDTGTHCWSPVWCSNQYPSSARSGLHPSMVALPDTASTAPQIGFTGKTAAPSLKPKKVLPRVQQSGDKPFFLWQSP